MIVLPMAGLSKRFTQQGYNLPKYMLPLGEGSVLSYVLAGFSSCFDDTEFLFIARDIGATATFIDNECARQGIGRHRTIMLANETDGQAHTIDLGIVAAGVPDDQALTIFNIDTFRSGFQFPQAAWRLRSAGYLEVFVGSGANWSYVEPLPGIDPVVARTAEKVEISDFCCDGLYHFSRAGDFRRAFARERSRPQAAELYVAPLYNWLIDDGLTIHYHLVDRDAVRFCGVPSEYEACRQILGPSLIDR